MKYIGFSIITIFLFLSCTISENQAVIASNEMMNNIIYNSNDIINYFHNSINSRDWISLNINFNDGKQNEYYNENMLKEYIELKNSFGDILNYEISNIEYVFEPLPLDNYGGHQHWIRIFFKCYYENNITEETIVGYYVKKIDKIKIIGCFLTIK